MDVEASGVAVPPGSAALGGLSSQEARRRLEQYGPNVIVEERRRPWRALLGKLWAPVPGMLAFAIGLELVLGRSVEAGVIAGLLVFNVGLSFAQEQRALDALEQLRQRLSIQARVRRDGRWRMVPASELVPGDLIRLRLGDLVPADVRLADGGLLVDQSAITGESLLAELGPGATAHAGTMVKRGEATGEVAATGPRTAFGKTAELVRVARTPSHLEEVILRIVRALVALDFLLVAAVLTYAGIVGLPLAEILPFALILLIASVPVALPATFTLASALGALELARRGVLVTRLSAIEEAAGMEVLCTDKTGTLTENRLTLAQLHPSPPQTPESLLRLATLASDAATQDPIDLAILAAASAQPADRSAPERLNFTPFDPSSRRSAATVRLGKEVWQVTKGAPATITRLLGTTDPTVAENVARLAGQGFRVLAVAAGPEGALQLAGLIALEDPVRPDAKALVHRLQDLGVRVLMVTGDSQATARAVAHQVGLGQRTCAVSVLQSEVTSAVLECDLFARVFPEDKFRLVRILQQAGKIVGMTGDGVNDAPALKQAEVGIAVAGATDAARAAASMVLTSPGLGEIVAAVETSRRIYQRLITYTLNKIIKTIQIAPLLSLGLLLAGIFVTSPRLVVLLLFANDFVTMAIATDHVGFARQPDRWQIRPLVLSALALALPLLLLSFGVLWIGRDVLELGLPELQTLVFVLLVFTGQATVYLVRERHHFWRSRPSRWLGLSSLVDVALVTLLATQGWLMAPISLSLVAAMLVASLAYLVVVDWLKVPLFARYGLR